MLCFLMLLSSLKAQTSEVDSLKAALQGADDTTRMQLYLELANKTAKEDPEFAIAQARAGIAIARELEDQEAELKFLNRIGYVYGKSRQLEKALRVQDSMVSMARTMGDKMRLMQALFNTANTYNTKNEKATAVLYMKEALQLGLETGDFRKTLSICNQLGNIFSYSAEYDSADHYLNFAVDLAKEIGDNSNHARILMNLGNNAARSNDFNKALAYYQRSFDQFEEINNPGGQKVVLAMMSVSALVQGNFLLALEYGQKELKIAEEGEDSLSLARSYERLSEVYLAMEDFPAALSFLEKAQGLYQRVGSEVNKYLIILKRGRIFYLRKENEKALATFREAYRIYHQGNPDIIPSELYLEMGRLFLDMGKLDSALFYLKQAEQQEKLANNFIEYAKSLNLIGKAYAAQGKADLAIETLEEAKAAGAQVGHLETERDVAELLYELYKSKGNAAKALEQLEEYKALNDSIFNKENIQEFTRLESEYQFEQEKQQLAFEQEKEIEQERQIQRIFILALVIAVVFILVIAWFYRSKQKANEELTIQKQTVEAQKEQLQELDQLKSRFFTNISHEFRTPLTVIRGMARQARMRPDKWSEKGLDLIERNSNQLLNLINQILDLRKLESGHLRAEFVQGDVVKFCRYLTESFHSMAESREIELVFESEEETILMDYDPEKYQRILSNLLSNALKFTPEGGEVSIRLALSKKDKATLLLEVKDSGIGIPAEKLPHIFDRFYQVDASSTRQGEGSGIGLSLSKELVQLLGGEISAESEEGKGSLFRIKLPVNHRAALEKEVQAPELDGIVDAQLEREPAAPLASSQNGEKLPSLLIIEDNADVVEYMIACLAGHYRLLIARNGQEGIDIALEEVPDLIVSDVMMPFKDGFEVCDTLKQDDRTSHIPIILLTARADHESRIKGLRRGADAYLAKPFDQEELLVRLEKLLELRQRLQARYTGTAQPSDESNPELEQEDTFIRTVREGIEANLSNHEYNIADMYELVGMSKTNFYRKLKALTGMSGIAYLRMIRLRKAHQLLLNSSLTISEIAYEVGFTDPKYFSRIFSKEYGFPPKSLRDSATEATDAGSSREES